jgi:predicted transcriptional regulator
MHNKIHNKNSKSPELQAFIVEPILIACMDDASIKDISKKAEMTLPSQLPILKHYLFYLIEYGFISYNGQRKYFSIEEEGWKMLHMISKEKKGNSIDSKDIVIILE